MKTILMLLALSPVWAQSTERVNRVVTLKHLDPVIAQNLLKDFGVDTRAERQLKVLVLTGPTAAVQTAEAALKQLDLPSAGQKDVDLTVFFVVGRNDNEGSGTAVPQELQSTVAALKQTFPFKNYELLDALALRTRAGSGASTTGQVASSRLTTFNVRSVNLEPDGMIRIDGLRAAIRALQNVGQSGGSQYVDVSGVSTDVVDVKEGQKLVVGRASMAGPDRALFLVLIAKVAQ
jgi:ethanolamine utilization microcompartment shell protein EutS